MKNSLFKHFIQGLSMHIAILHDYFDKKGGGERLVINLAKALKADIYTGFIEKEKTFDIKGINIVSLGINKNQSVFRRNLEISKKFSKLKLNYDFYIFSGVYCISAAHLKPNLLYLHTPLRAMYDLKEYFMKQSNLKGKLMLKLASLYWKPKDQKYMRQFNIICPNSENVKNRVLRFYGSELYNKCNVVYTGIETNKFYNKKSEGFYLSASRLDKLKRIDLLIEAFREMPDKTLFITGIGPDEERLKDLASDCNNIQFLGSVDDKEMKRLYAECFATICCNVDEDLGLTPIESNASGKPSLCVKEGGFKETIIENVNGLFFEPNTYSLVSTIKKADKIKWNATKIKKTSEKYDIKVFVKKIREIIEKLSKAS